MANRLLDLFNNTEAGQDLRNHSDSKEEYLNTIQKYLPDYSENELDDDLAEIKKSNPTASEGQLDLDQLDQVAGGVAFMACRWFAAPNSSF